MSERAHYLKTETDVFPGKMCGNMEAKAWTERKEAMNRSEGGGAVGLAVKEIKSRKSDFELLKIK